MKENTPLVSIIIPVYNGSEYMKTAIDSALGQTYQNIEVIVVNDGSTDNGKTDEIARGYGDRIRYFSKENGGVSTALNYGIREMRGEFFSWLSHDDEYETNKIEIQINDVLRLRAEGKETDRSMFYCCGALMNSEGTIIRKNYDIYKNGWYRGNDVLEIMFRGHMLGGCGLLIPKRMFEEVGLFDETMRYMQDVFMWEKAFIAGYSLYVNEACMVKTRRHNKQTSVTGKAYGVRDREVVGTYLSHHLKGLESSDGKNLLKVYMNLCMRNNSLSVGNKIYKDLCAEKELSFCEKVHANWLRSYGKVRILLSKVYYTVLYRSGR